MLDGLALRKIFLPSLAGVLVGCGDIPPPSDPKVILIIGDGMDDQQITIARNYLVGSSGRLVLDGLPYRGASIVQTVAEDDPTRPVYVADSANTATSMATGELTSPGRIATTPVTDEDIPTIMEFAHEAGFGTGIVTTSSVTDATPAAFFTHISYRYCWSPSLMEAEFGPLDNISTDCAADYRANGGPGSISEQIAASDVDVVLGGGTTHFQQPAEAGEPSVLDLAAGNGYRVALDRSELTEIPVGGKVLGLFAPNTMPVMWRGKEDSIAIAVERGADSLRLPEPFVCDDNPEFSSMPTLVEMTRTALTHLHPLGGFMLMIESASIDKQSHLRRPCGHIGELRQLDETLAVVLEYAAENPETLIIVTADHSHAAQIVHDEGGWLAFNYASPGRVGRLRTPEGAIMSINYATNDSPFTEYHTGAHVPIYAFGPGADELPATWTQREIFGLMSGHLGLEANPTH